MKMFKIMLRLVVLCDDAYPGDNITVDHIQKQLVETFTDGVKDNAIARKLIREKPITLEKALEIATQEQQTARAFELRREETPMEVDAISKIEQTMEKHINDLISKVDTALSMIVSAVQTQNTPQEKTFAYKKKYEFTKDGKPICAYCKKIGHIRAKCKARPNKDYSRQNQEN